MFQGRLRSVHALQEDAGAGLPDTHGDSGEETWRHTTHQQIHECFITGC